MLIFMSLPFNYIKHHSKCGLHSACVSASVCQGLVLLSLLCQTKLGFLGPVTERTHHLTAFLFFPSQPTTPPCARLFLRAGSHGRCGQFHVPSFPVADCRGGSECHASLILTSWDSSTVTRRGLVDRTQSAQRHMQINKHTVHACCGEHAQEHVCEHVCKKNELSQRA